MTQTKRIYSENADYQRFGVLKTNRNKRTRYGAFLCEGVRNLNEALKNGWRFESLLYSFEGELSRWAREMIDKVPSRVNYAMPRALLSRLSGKEDTSELMAVIAMRNLSVDDILGDLSENPVLALFDRPSNHGNLGTILRSADALGVEALVLTGHGVDLYDPDVVASTMGSFFKVPALRLSSNEEIFGLFASLRAKYPTLQILGTTAHAQDRLCDADLTRPTLFLIGNETEGLTRTYREVCDVNVRIPMAADSYATSFNVGCAATVMFYEAARQRDMK